MLVDVGAAYSVARQRVVLGARSPAFSHIQLLRRGAEQTLQVDPVAEGMPEDVVGFHLASSAQMLRRLAATQVIRRAASCRNNGSLSDSRS